MGVEPIAAGSAPPATGFEDQGAHRDTCPPTHIVLNSRRGGKPMSTSDAAPLVPLGSGNSESGYPSIAPP
jgi:hypothetical protein